MKLSFILNYGIPRAMPHFSSSYSYIVPYTVVLHITAINVAGDMIFFPNLAQSQIAANRNIRYCLMSSLLQMIAKSTMHRHPLLSLMHELHR
jgi:hypothetical protein